MTAPAPEKTGTETDDTLNHIVCPDCGTSDVAFCGLDVSHMDWMEDDFDDPDECIVCREIALSSGCPVCGT